MPNISTEKQYYVSSKNRTIALLLTCVGFFGVAGLQRLYVGKTVSGILYLLTCGGFLLGSIYDLYSIYNETFTDCDGFPLFADSSLKSNYHRRTPHKSVNYFALGFFAIWSIMLFGSMLATVAMHNEVPQEKTQINNEQQTANEKSEKEKRKKGNEPILDIPMSNSAVENIKNIVITNSPEDNINDLRYEDINIDTSSGKANVVVCLHGAKSLTIWGTIGSFDEAIKRIMAALYQVNTGIEIANVKVIVNMDVSYPNGATETISAYALGMNSKTAQNMHWDNYKRISIDTVADVYEVHPALQREMDRASRQSTLEQIADTVSSNL